MNQTEFIDLHSSCDTAMRAYFVEAEKTAAMLSKCTPEPLSFAERLILISQEILEHDKHLLYVSIKHQLHDAARLGYGSSG